ncbi:MAG: penicillin acylase family protein [Bryobacteraceae bacterium]
MRRTLLLLALVLPLSAADVPVAGLKSPVEILRDRWGVPHIYAQNVDDLFFAQGYMAARDRLFQIDLWRRVGTGKLAEVLGPSAIPRDRLARAVRYRGDPQAEWASYDTETQRIATAFTRGVNAYIRSLNGARPIEFRIAGYDPGLWEPEDCLARVAGLLMTRNLTREVARAQDARRFGLPTLQKLLAPDPPIKLELPNGLDLAEINDDILKVYTETISAVRFSGEQGSNNWIVDGSMSVTGKPIMASDPHRPVLIPSLRKTVHLVAPGWNAIGAGEPALPGIALGHNDRIGFGFTIVGIDQGDLYLEKLNPANRDEYSYKGGWRKVEIVRERIPVKGAEPRAVDLRYTVHGPILHEDHARNRAYALKWVGSEPGTAGYLAGLSLARARNWQEFEAAIARYKVPSENILYGDVDGNIGWYASGMTPIRKNWSGLFPVPGDSGEYEWSGFRKSTELPHLYNPASHWIATANHNILPKDYGIPLGYEWALPFRFQRIQEMLSEKRKFSVADFERMQQDITSMPARRFQNILRKWKPSVEQKLVEQLVSWDARLTVDSFPALVFEVWMTKLPAAVFGPDLGGKVNLMKLLDTLDAEPNPKALQQSLMEALRQLEKQFGADRAQWQWGKVHRIRFQHPLNRKEFDRGPYSRPGDGNTVNSTSGANLLQTNGASYRQILDFGDWDKSVMTNVPGESGDPASPHYSDLIEDWAAGKYHPMPFSRKAVEAATVERINLKPR